MMITPPLLLMSFAVSCHGLASTSTASNKPHILSVGLAAVDFVATVDSSTTGGFPKPDDKIRSTSLVVEGGGNAANTASAIGRSMPLYANVSIVTAVGDDANGQTIVDGLKAMNVNVDYIEQYEGSSPFTYILSTEIDGDNTRTCIHQPSTGDLSIDFVNDKIVPQLLDTFTAAHFDVRYPQAAVALARKLAKAKIPYSVDVERPREGLDDLLQDATVVICNSDYCDSVLAAGDEEEDDDTDDSDTVQQRLRKVISKKAPKAQLAVQTLGSKGSCLIWMNNAKDDDDDKTEEQDEEDVILLKDKKDPNAPVVTLKKKDGALFCSAFKGCKVVDTTGAGDSFQGGFIAALWAYVYNNNNSQKNDSSSTAGVQVPTNAKVLGHALRIATRVAAKKVEKPGARRGLPDGKTDTFIQSEMKAMLLLLDDDELLTTKEPTTTTKKSSSVRPTSIVR